MNSEDVPGSVPDGVIKDMVCCVGRVDGTVDFIKYILLPGGGVRSWTVLAEEQGGMRRNFFFKRIPDVLIKNVLLYEKEELLYLGKYRVWYYVVEKCAGCAYTYQTQIGQNGCCSGRRPMWIDPKYYARVPELNGTILCDTCVKQFQANGTRMAFLGDMIRMIRRWRIKLRHWNLLVVKL